MQYKAFGDTIILRLERGEEIVANLTALCEQEKITLGQVSGLGAVDYVEAGYYQVAEQQYHKHVYDQEAEIISLTGSITQMNGEVYLHLHIAISDAEGKMHGGHLNAAKISATAEIFVTRLSGTVERWKDEAVGLNLMDLS